MFPDDVQPEDRPPRLTHVIYNAALGHVRVRHEDSLATTIEIPPGEVRFRRVLGAREPEAPLWLDSVECDVLVRLVEHACSDLRVAPEYAAPLAAVREKLAELAALPTISSRPDGEAGAARGPLIVPATPTPDAPMAAEVAEVAPAPEAEAARAASAEPAADAPAAAGRGAGARRPPVRRTPGRGGAADRPQRPLGAPEADKPPSPGQVSAPDGATTTANEAGAREAEQVAADTAPAPPAARAGEGGAHLPGSFGEVWHDLQVLAAQQPTLHALAGQVGSEVREVADDGIWVYSHGIGREYRVQRDQLEVAWKALTAAGRLVARDLGLSQGAVTLLAHLPYVEYSAQPVTLHFPSEAPHALGTVLRREPDS